MERWKELKKKEKLLKEAAQLLRVPEKELPNVVRRFKKEIEEMEKKLNILLKEE